MAKVAVSARVKPETLGRIDETASMMGVSRGELISQTLESAYGAGFNPAKAASDIANNKVTEVVALLDALKQQLLAQVDTLTPEQLEQMRRGLSG